MRLAIEEAKKGRGFVSPNPLVGCVILDKDGDLIGKGHHARAGAPHAEINALNSITDKSRIEGAHLYVTLEPCAHHGRTPPCADALARLPLKSVTYGIKDPFPQVSGKGIEIVRAGGIEVRTLPELHDELENLAEVFLMNVRQRKTFAALKVATSLDGQVALKTGESQWITGPAARDHVQYLRGAHDAVMVGVGTFFRDDPKLNSRAEAFAGKPQKAVLLDPEGLSLARLLGSALLSVRKREELFLLTGPDVRLPPELSGVTHLPLPLTNGLMDWREILTALLKAGINSVLVEGGANVLSGLLCSRMADRLYVYIAAKILGEGLSWTSALKIESLKYAIELSAVEHQSFGPDLLVTGRLIFP